MDPSWSKNPSQTGCKSTCKKSLVKNLCNAIRKRASKGVLGPLQESQNSQSRIHTRPRGGGPRGGPGPREGAQVGDQRPDTLSRRSALADIHTHTYLYIYGFRLFKILKWVPRIYGYSPFKCPRFWVLSANQSERSFPRKSLGSFPLLSAYVQRWFREVIRAFQQTKVNGRSQGRV